MSQQQQEDPFNQLYQKLKNEYVAKKAASASMEFDGIVTPFVGIIINQSNQIKLLEEKLPKKQRVKIIKKNKKHV